MKEFIKKNMKWFGYIFFCIIIAAGLLYYRFPSDTLKDYLQITAKKLHSSVTLSIGQIKPSLAFGLTLKQSELSNKDNPAKKLFRADSLFIKPDGWAYLKGKKKYYFKCSAYKGDIKGYVNIKKNSAAIPFDTEIELRDIDLAKHEQLKSLTGWQVDGILSASIFFTGEYKNLIDGNGEVRLKLVDGTIDLSVPILTIGTVAFQEIKGDMTLKRQMINLKHLELEGPLMKSSITGTISLKKKFEKSILNLKGTIEPFASFFKSMGSVSKTVTLFKQRLKRGVIHFMIQGTLDDPKTRLMS